MKHLIALFAFALAGCAADSSSLEPRADAFGEETMGSSFEASPLGEGFDQSCGSAVASSSDALSCGDTRSEAARERLARNLDAGVVGFDAERHTLIAPVELGGRCQNRIREVMGMPALPGAPALEAVRGRVLAYAKAEPVLFTETPAYDAESTPAVRTYRAMLERSSSPWSLLQRLGTLFTVNPVLGRSVLLRNGYLYAERPEMAFALVDLVRAHHLFNAPRLWIQRGDKTLFAERTPFGPYNYASGPQRGQRVRLLLFDRIGEGEPPEPLHRDFRALRKTLGFERVRVQHIAASAIVAELRYGSHWVPTVLKTEGARVELDCELVLPEVEPRVVGIRAVHERQARVATALRRAMQAGIDEGLPFDEPVTEYGQQDGQLRRYWLRSYLEGKSFYEINGDRYATFDALGRPLVPQVCVDFVFDTLERASGTWWRPRGQRPERILGKLDFGTTADQTLRRISSLLELSQAKTDWFEFLEVPDAQRIPLKNSASLVDYLLENANEFVPGDIVLIRGYAPWDKPWRPKIMHSHSLFVYETDPITGFPSMLVGNPGKPVLQTWQFEAFRTPERSIWYRIRPRLSWLEQIIVPSADEAADLAFSPVSPVSN